jgi:hypothetical protein
MTLSQEMNETIEQKMAALDKDNLLRPGMSYNDFVGDYSNLIAQAQKDMPLLSGAGFDVLLMPLYTGYLDKLVLEQGERVAVEGETTENEAAFATGMPKAREDRKLLLAMGRYVVKRTKNPEAKRVYKMVSAGSGDVDTLNDNVAMVSFARKYKDHVAKVRPGGRVIDEAELARIETEALALLKLRGESSTDAKTPSSQVSRKRRIVSLCVEASREIRLLAEMAFYNDLDYYNRFYASTHKPSAGSSPTETQPTQESKQK